MRAEPRWSSTNESGEPCLEVGDGGPAASHPVRLRGEVQRGLRLEGEARHRGVRHCQPAQPWGEVLQGWSYK